MIVIIIQARMSSTRLPGKILKELAGKPMLWHVVMRAMRSQKADKVIVATTADPVDDAVEAFCKEYNFLCSRGSRENVLSRYYEAAKKYRATTIVRVTSDCPLIDPAIIDKCIEAFENAKCDYLSNAYSGKRTFPRGLDCEVFSFAALEKTYHEATEDYEKEHVTPRMWKNKKGEYVLGPNITASPEYARTYRLTVDFPEDFQLIELLYKRFYTPGSIVDVPEVISYLDRHPEVVAINAHCEAKQARV